MRSEEFIEKYGHKYEYDWDEYDSDRVSIYSDSETNIDLGHIVIEFYYDSHYSVYRKFLYEDQYSQVLTLDINRDELLFKESVKRVWGQNPETDCHLGYGCPFFSVVVGFFDMSFSWENLNQTLELMKEACLLMKTLTLADIDHSSEDCKLYLKRQEELLDEVKEYAPSLCHTRLENSVLNHNHCFDSMCAYIDEHAGVITGVGIDDVLRLTGGLSPGNIHVYFGFQHFVVQDEKLGIAITNQKTVDQVLNMFRTFDEEEEYDISVKFSLSEKFRIIIFYGALWAAFIPVRTEHYEFCLTSEKNFLKIRQRQFLSVAPKSLWERDCDFSKLDDSQFEFFCRDILSSMGFQNIHLQGKTNAPDGGIDITAEEEFQTKVGHEKRIWIFQCKHTKHQISRKDISEVPYLLKEFHADCYGLFYSGIFSPTTLNRIRCVSEECRNPIKYWDSNDLELLLENYPKIHARYFAF